MGDTLKVDAAPGDASALSDDPAARVGTILAGKYSLLRLLGAGGMGAVYEAENTWTGRRVALKVMLPSAARGFSATERFAREARATTKVQHPNIVEVLDAGQSPSDGALYIVQELLLGSDLRALLKERGALPWSEAIGLLAPVMAALAEAHRQGIVHRDVKPENIFLADTASGRVPKLIDFGIARLLDGEATPNLTRSGALMGTPYYMSPEQARGLRDIDARADVWAMAVVLREALTGVRPFVGDNYNALIVAIVNDPITPASAVLPGVSAATCAAIDRALSRDPARRFADMGAFLEAIQRADTTAQTAASPAPIVAPPAARSSRGLAVALVLGLLVATAAMVSRFSRTTAAREISPPVAQLRSDPPREPPQAAAPETPRPPVPTMVVPTVAAPSAPERAAPAEPRPSKVRTLRRALQTPAREAIPVPTRPSSGLIGNLREQ